MVKRTNGSGRTGHNSGALWLSRAYEVIDYDPEIDVFVKLWHQEKVKEGDLAALAGLSPNTVTNLGSGKTRRPQHATFAKLAAAMGRKYSLVLDGAHPNYEAEIPKAREQYRDYRKMKAKQRKRKR